MNEYKYTSSGSNKSDTETSWKEKGKGRDNSLNNSGKTNSPSTQSDTSSPRLTPTTTSSSSSAVTPTTLSSNTLSSSSTTTTTTTTTTTSSARSSSASPATSRGGTQTPSTNASNANQTEGAMSAPTGRQVPKRRMRRRATSQSQDPAEQLTEMSVRGLNLFRYASINEGVYQCTECAKLDIQKTFKNKYSFQRHAFLYHEGHQRKVFPCPVCGKEFSRPDKMKNHMKTVHDCFMPKDCVMPFGFFLPP
ncbi:hypothetical protein PV326_001234 [Microctonus aethiopoides]|nr:hypothetical protein PV326_001234 [Microctonus aethiopoides]